MSKNQQPNSLSLASGQRERSTRPKGTGGHVSPKTGSEERPTRPRLRRRPQIFLLWWAVGPKIKSKMSQLLSRQSRASRGQSSVLGGASAVSSQATGSSFPWECDSSSILYYPLKPYYIHQNSFTAQYKSPQQAFPQSALDWTERKSLSPQEHSYKIINLTYNSYWAAARPSRMGNCQCLEGEKIVKTKLPLKTDLATKNAGKSWQDLLDLKEMTVPEVDAIAGKNMPICNAEVQIEKDKDRTYPNQAYFQQAENKLRFVDLLKKVAVIFPKVSYTQGMNFLAGHLLLYGMTEEQALKSIIKLFKSRDSLMIGLYEDEFPLVKLYCEIFWRIIQRKMPKIAIKIRQIGYEDEMWLYPWFITFFCNSLPQKLMKSLFSFVLEDLYFSPVRLAVGIMLSLESKFEYFDDFEGDFCLLQQDLKSPILCVGYLISETVIQNARRITIPQINAELANSKTKNWYKQYFVSAPSEKQRLYNQKMSALNEQFKDYCNKMIANSIVMQYERHMVYTNVLDIIESKKMERQTDRFARSLSEKKVYLSFDDIRLSVPIQRILEQLPERIKYTNVESCFLESKIDVIE